MYAPPPPRCAPCCGPRRTARSPARRFNSRSPRTAERSAGSWPPAQGRGTGWGCVSGARWAVPARARITAGSCRPIFRGRRLIGSTRAERWKVGMMVGGPVLLLSIVPSFHLSAQGVLNQFSYDNLRLSGIQVDLGPLGASELKGAIVGGMRLDY